MNEGCGQGWHSNDSSQQVGPQPISTSQVHLPGWFLAAFFDFHFYFRTWFLLPPFFIVATKVILYCREDFFPFPSSFPFNSLHTYLSVYYAPGTDSDTANIGLTETHRVSVFWVLIFRDVRQCFPNINVCENHLGSVKMQIPIQEVWGGAKDHSSLV